MHALVLTDVVDSTRLSEALGPQALADLWAEHDRTARDLLEQHGGREIDKSDGFLLLFDSVPQAVAWTLAYHRASPLPARAGVHWGPVTLRENSAQDVARGAKMLEVEGLAKPTAARIMTLAIGGQTLLSKAAVDELGVLTSGVETLSHGFWRLKGVSEPMELFEVGADQAPFTPPPDSPKVWRVVNRDGVWSPLREIPRSLPAERDPFIGRQSALRALAKHMDSGARLVSVLGTGGTGKTRLALHYARTWLGAWSGGALFCDLSEARSAQGIASAVANTLELPLRGTDSVGKVGAALAERGPSLVVLDNFEQVSRDAPQTLGRWLDQAPQVQFLVTSREVLGLPGERILALPPLSQADAEALFTQRALVSRGQRPFLPEEQAAVAELVQLVDRLPLAIELAAARCRSMSPQAIRERMGQRFRLLASQGGRLDRQATLRATLDWSWELLDPEEQAALAQLSVFEGPFDLGAVESVVDTDQQSWPADLLQALVDKSLVRHLGQDRFSLLMSIHAYARERLVRADEATLRHAQHYAQWGAPGAMDALHGPSGTERWTRMRRQLDNLVAACRRATALKTPELAAQSVLAAVEVLQTVGPFALGEELIRPVLALPHPPARKARLHIARAKILGLMGPGPKQQAQLERAAEQAALADDPILALQVRAQRAVALVDAGALQQAEAELKACLADPHAEPDSRLAGVVHNALGMLTSNMGRSREARQHLAAAVAIHRGLGDRAAEARALGNLGSNAATQLENLAHLQGALALHQQLGNRRSEAVVLGNLGRVCRRLGRVEEAYRHSLRSLELHRELGKRRSVGIQLLTLGSMDRIAARPGARVRLEQALYMQRQTEFRRGEGYCCVELAMLELGEGDLRTAETLLQSALALSEGYAGVAALAQAALALVRCAEGRPHQALALAQDIQATEKTKAFALAVWAWSAALSGERVQAEQCLAALDALPEDLIEEPKALRERSVGLLKRQL